MHPMLLFHGKAQETLFIRVMRDALVRGHQHHWRMNCGHFVGPVNPYPETMPWLMAGDAIVELGSLRAMGMVGVWKKPASYS